MRHKGLPCITCGGAIVDKLRGYKCRHCVVAAATAAKRVRRAEKRTPPDVKRKTHLWELSLANVERRRLRAQGLAKLTPEERLALGLEGES